VAVGPAAGNIDQGTQSVAVGKNAGVVSQGANSVAVGNSSGFDNQGLSSVAVGLDAGRQRQGNNSVAIGNQSGFSLQGNNAVAVGNGAGSISQGTGSVAIGSQAGAGSQPANTIILNASGSTVNGVNGQTGSFYVKPVRNQPSSAGLQSLQYNTSTSEITYGPLGAGGGISQVGTSFGNYLYWDGTTWVVGDRNISIGANAGKTNQDTDAIALGTTAGQTDQGSSSIAVGNSSGNDEQGEKAVAIGLSSGNFKQGENAVAIGPSAGNNSQGTSSVAIGESAGLLVQGGNSIAIGKRAGFLNQPANTIILNASGSNVNGVVGQTDSFYVKPVRGDTKSSLLTNGFTGPVYYNPTTSEVAYASSSLANSLIAETPVTIPANDQYNVYSATTAGLYLVVFTNQGPTTIKLYSGSTILYFDGTIMYGGYDYGTTTDIRIKGVTSSITFLNQSADPLTFVFQVFNMT
jgi:hypothetical protein